MTTPAVAQAPTRQGNTYPVRRLLMVVLAALVCVGALTTVAPAVVDEVTPVTASAAAEGTCDQIRGKLGILGRVAGGGCDLLSKGPTGVLADKVGEGFKSMAQSMWNGYYRMLALSFSWFIKVPTPNYQEWSAVQKVQQFTLWVQLAFLTLSIMIGGFRLVMAKRNAVYGETQESFMSMAKSVFGAWVFGGALTACTSASDALANWLLTKGIDGSDPNKMLKNMFETGLIAFGGSGLVFIIAIIGILGALLQVVILVSRQAMLTVIVALIPVVGAAGGTQVGKSAFSKLINWTIAFLLWKPVAACVYLVAFLMIGTDAKRDAQQVILGVILMTMSIAVLPMLMKLVSGGMAMSGGSGLAAAGMVMGAVAAGGTMVATGGASAAAGGGAAAGGATGSTAAQAGAGGAAGGGASGAAGGGSGGGGGGGSRGTGTPSGAGSQPGGGTSGGGRHSAGGGQQPGGGTGGLGQPSATSTGDGSSVGGSTASAAGHGSSGTGSTLTDLSGAGSQMSSAAENFFDGGDSGEGERGDLR